MNRKSEINEIAGIKTRLTKLQTQSNKLKNIFFEYIEGLNSAYNVLSNYNREDFTFDILGNKLKLQATYDNEETLARRSLTLIVGRWSYGSSLLPLARLVHPVGIKAPL